nr:RNA polymerase, subunit H/Rpb5, conserved site-containing protein [Ipomoea batatas]
MSPFDIIAGKQDKTWKPCFLVYVAPSCWLQVGLQAIPTISVMSNVSAVIPGMKFQSKWYSMCAKGATVLTKPSASPGHILLPEPKGKNSKWFPMKSIELLSNLSGIKLSGFSQYLGSLAKAHAFINTLALTELDLLYGELPATDSCSRRGREEISRRETHPQTQTLPAVIPVGRKREVRTIVEQYLGGHQFCPGSENHVLSS